VRPSSARPRLDGFAKMNIRYLKSSSYLQALRPLKEGSLDSIIIAGSHILNVGGDNAFDQALRESVRVLKATGLLFVQGTPQNLPSRLGPFVRSLQFKYWIAIESSRMRDGPGLPATHATVVLLARSRKTVKINRVRFAHKHCAFCNRTLKDWGGKSHLMNPAGYALSDIWRDLPRRDNHTRLSLPVLEVLLRLVDTEDGRCLIFPYEGIDFDGNHFAEKVSARVQASSSIAPPDSASISRIPEALLDAVHCGDAVEILRKYPDNSVDLAFADPPYNLAKAYENYDDEKADEGYLAWCNSWLTEYIRVLKPNGSLYIVNLPKWAIHHAAFLNKCLHFQNWIAWDAISEPRGKIMPAHYALLFYTKHPTDFRFNYDDVSPVDAPSFCLRASCVKERKEQGIDPKVPLTDIWWDIHRIKHKRDRDRHPCQLPEKLMERIIRLSSNKGDIVLDALCGAGTTALAAYRLGRRFIAIDIDKRYADMTAAKLRQLRTWGFVPRKREAKRPREVTKKALQLELRHLAEKLGRLPTQEDVRQMSEYDLELFLETFPTWGKALKAAKLRMPH
jgi:DNA modification methylase